jgi:hypothetical protein
MSVLQTKPRRDWLKASSPASSVRGQTVRLIGCFFNGLLTPGNRLRAAFLNFRRACRQRGYSLPAASASFGEAQPMTPLKGNAGARR